MKLENMVNQAFNLILDAPGNIVNAIKASIGLISAGTGNLYRSISGLFSANPQKAIPHTLLNITAALNEGKIAQELLPDDVDFDSLLRVPDIFRDRGRPESERSLKANISSRAADLLVDLGESYSLRERGVIVFNKINMLLQKYRLLDGNPNNYSQLLGGVLREKIKTLQERLYASEQRIHEKYRGTPYARDGHIEFDMRVTKSDLMNELEAFMSRMEKVNWGPLK